MTATMESPTSQSAPAPAAPRELARLESSDVLWDTAGFEHAQRIARLFASSPYVPEHLRGKPGKKGYDPMVAVANCTIALLMAKRMNEDPLVVMQSMYMVSGKPGWSSQYLIARANRSGVFRGRIGWKVKKLEPARLALKRKVKAGWDEQANQPIYREVDATIPNLAVTAFATIKDTDELVEYEVTSGMAVEEGWADNAKYSTLGELMLRYRSATFLVRLYAPDVMLGGTTTAEELEDVAARNGAIETTAEVLPVSPAPTATPTWRMTTEQLGELRRIQGAKKIPLEDQKRIVETATGRPDLTLWTAGIETAIATQAHFDAVRAALNFWRPAEIAPQAGAAPAPVREPGDDLADEAADPENRKKS